jgi:hypothetical protein
MYFTIFYLYVLWFYTSQWVGLTWKLNCQKLSTDVPLYPNKSAFLNFPKPNAFCVNYCSPLTDQDLMSRTSWVSSRADHSTVISWNGRNYILCALSVIWAGRKESGKEKKNICLAKKFHAKHVSKLGGQNVEFYCVKS